MMGMLASAGRIIRLGMVFLVLAVGLGGCAMPKSIPNPPTPLPIVELGKRAHADVSRPKLVPLEIWQSTPALL